MPPPPPHHPTKKVLRMFDGILEHAVRAWSDIITVIWAEARKYWFSKLGQTATHCQIFRREQRRRGRQDNTRLKRGEGGGPSRDEQGSFFSNRQGGQSKRKIARDGAGHARAKVCRSGLDKKVGRWGFHIYPPSAASFALFLGAGRCGAGRVMCGAGRGRPYPCRRGFHPWFQA